MRNELLTRENAEVFKDFHCGDEPFAVEVAEWVRSEEVWFAVENLGVEVFLYFTENDEFIGFISLGLQSIRLDDEQTELGELPIIPYFGLRTEFQGKPEGDKEKRYGRLIFREAVALAKSRAHPSRKLALYVSPENTRAIALYAADGFRKVGTFAGYDCMLKDF